MTTHTLRLEVEKGEMTYVRARIICSDDGGLDCARPVPAPDCEDLADDRRDFIADQLDLGVSEEDAIAEWHWDIESYATTCDGHWWEGEHYHPGPVGTGCTFEDWANEDQANLELSAETHVQLPVELAWQGSEDPILVRPIMSPALGAALPLVTLARVTLEGVRL